MLFCCCFCFCIVTSKNNESVMQMGGTAAELLESNPTSDTCTLLISAVALVISWYGRSCMLCFSVCACVRAKVQVAEVEILQAHQSLIQVSLRVQKEYNAHIIYVYYIIVFITLL